jgi:hypothetical protein
MESMESKLTWARYDNTLRSRAAAAPPHGGDVYHNWVVGVEHKGRALLRRRSFPVRDTHQRISSFNGYYD